MLATLRSLSLVTRFVTTVFPQVSRELTIWQQHAAACPEQELAKQALASIRHKKFHCLGGSIYSLYPNSSRQSLLRLIVALQTISDYLDNLCDRTGIYDETAFHQLHLAMTEALDPDAGISDYYAAYPLKEDGGYLTALVTACRREAASLPAYQLVKPHVLQLANLYSTLQTLKHLHPAVREEKMLSWINTLLPAYPNLNPWEFAAATGSTLGMFMLCAAASNAALTSQQAAALQQAYFPYIAGLHILLDYYIDAAEDREHGDLNFVAYYKNSRQTAERLVWISRQALTVANSLPEPVFHNSVVKGLLAMYLSDPKTTPLPERTIKNALLKQAGRYTQVLYSICRGLRLARIL